MHLRRVTLAVFVLAVLVIPQSLSAQVASPEKPTCLEQAAQRIHPGGKLTILKLDGEKKTGRLKSIDLNNSHLLLRGLTLNDPYLALFRQEEIAKIQCSKPGEIKPGFMALGLLGGALVGGLIGAGFTEKSGDFSFGGEAAIGIGAAIGGGFGLFAGTFIPLALPSTVTIECK